MFDRDEAIHLLAYEAWASRRLAEVLERSAPPRPEALRLWGHVVASVECWLDRIQGRSVKPGTWWPSATLVELAARRASTERAWRDWAERLDPTELAREVCFGNSAGLPCHDPIEAIVHHVVDHGTHHRAQVASLLRAAGESPPAIDYIAWRREVQARVTLDN